MEVSTVTAVTTVTTMSEAEVGEYDVLFAPAVVARLEEEGDHTEALVREQCEALAEAPRPPSDGESATSALPWGAENWYYRHTGRHWAVFFLVDDHAKEVRITHVEDLDETHPKYEL